MQGGAALATNKYINSQVHVTVSTLSRHLCLLFHQRAMVTMGEPFRAISDPSNWQSGHFPCPVSRVIFPESANVLIDTTLKASQVVLPKNGAIVFTADGSIEMEERMSDLESTVSCAFGQDAFFIGNLHHSHDSPGSVVSWLLRLLVDVIAIVAITGIAYGVYLHRTQGYTASQVIHHLWQRATARLTVTNVSPLQGTFNFVRFHGDEGHLEMEMGRPSCTVDESHSGPAARTAT